MIRITQKEFNKLRDIDRLMIHTALSHRQQQAIFISMIGVISGLFALHNLFLFNILSAEFFFVVELSCIFYSVYLFDRNIKAMHSQFFDEDGNVKESYLKKYKIKS